MERTSQILSGTLSLSNGNQVTGDVPRHAVPKPRTVKRQLSLVSKPLFLVLAWSGLLCQPARPRAGDCKLLRALRSSYFMRSRDVDHLLDLPLRTCELATRDVIAPRSCCGFAHWKRILKRDSHTKRSARSDTHKTKHESAAHSTVVSQAAVDHTCWSQSNKRRAFRVFKKRGEPMWYRLLAGERHLQSLCC